MVLRKGQRVRELSKKVGQSTRHGKVVSVHGHTVEIKWDDGHVTSVSDGLFVVEEPEHADK